MGKLLVPGSNILEIEIEPDLITPPTPRVDVETEPKQAFVDPAIVSYGKRGEIASVLPGNAQVEGPRHWEPDAPVSANAAQAQSLSTMTTIPTKSFDTTAIEQSGVFRQIPSPKAIDNTAASATLSEPFNDLALNGPAQQALGSGIDHHDHRVTTQRQKPTGVAPASASRSTRRRSKRESTREGMVSTPLQTPRKAEVVSTPLSNQKRRSNSNKKGWRQTPLLEEPTLANIRLPRAHQALSPPAPALTLGSPGQTRPTPEPTKVRQRRIQEEEDQNGWATGEATDIQDMGDFDFEENHKKFDKRKVFDQIRRDDTTADEARLVSYNRLSSIRPGTAGGKNLHYTENVLDSPVQKIVEHSSGDSDVDISEARISSGRSLSRTSTRRNVPSRKGSALVNASLDRVASPKLRSESTMSFRRSLLNQPKLSLVLRSSNRPCPCITPLQMLELEQLATTELGLSEDMMTENAARSIAENAYGLRSGDDRQSISAPIVILAGNNKTGSRAIAAGRHLRNHGTRVVLCILGLEREDDLLDSVRRQLKIFRHCGGQAIKQDALMRTLRKLQSPTRLIIDALLGIHVSFDDLRTDDEAAYFQLVCWANGCDADTLALDVPSGIDASTGTFLFHSCTVLAAHLQDSLTGVSTFHDSSPLVINAQHVVSLGAPKTGLLTSLFDMDEESRPNLAVADIGISPVAWKKFGTRRRHGVDFGGVWLAPLEVSHGTPL